MQLIPHCQFISGVNGPLRQKVWSTQDAEADLLAKIQQQWVPIVFGRATSVSCMKGTLRFANPKHNAMLCAFLPARSHLCSVLPSSQTQMLFRNVTSEETITSENNCVLCTNLSGMSVEGGGVAYPWGGGVYLGPYMDDGHQGLLQYYLAPFSKAAK